MKIRVQMPVGTSSVSVGGESYTPDGDGVVSLNSPEHVAPLVAAGGIELNEDGTPGQTSTLIGSDAFPAMIELGHGQDDVQLGSIVAETQARTGISTDEWNNLPQQVRDILIGMAIDFRRGDIVRNGADDPRVTELTDKVVELEGTITTLREQLTTAEAKPAAADEASAAGGTGTTAATERPAFAEMTKATINDWLKNNGSDELTTGNHDAFVAAANARFDVLYPAEQSA